MIEIQNYKPVNKGVVIATFNAKIQKWGDFIIRDLTLFEKNGSRWVSMPSKQYTNQAGEKKYFSYCLFENPDVAKKFNEKILEEVKILLMKNPSLGQAPKSITTPDNEVPF